jgi:hypothetical protein
VAHFSSVLGNWGVIDPNVPERLQHVRTFGGKDVNDSVEPFELNLIRLELGPVPQRWNQGNEGRQAPSSSGGPSLGALGIKMEIPWACPMQIPSLTTESRRKLTNGSTMSQVNAAGKHYTWKSLIMSAATWP